MATNSVAKNKGAASGRREQSHKAQPVLDYVQTSITNFGGTGDDDNGFLEIYYLDPTVCCLTAWIYIDGDMTDANAKLVKVGVGTPTTDTYAFPDTADYGDFDFSAATKASLVKGIKVDLNFEGAKSDARSLALDLSGITKVADNSLTVRAYVHIGRRSSV